MIVSAPSVIIQVKAKKRSKSDMDRSELIKKIETLPNSPGAYMMKNEAGRVIYVGKARELKKRVSSYFRDNERKDPKTKLLIKNIADIDFIVTDTEAEALLTEVTLIKEYRPRYNIDLKDDKNYLCLRMDKSEDFPRFTLIRNMRRDGAIYFGPYTEAKAIRNSLKWLSATFGLRQCTDHKFKNRTRPCLYYEIGQCSGPCSELISLEEYVKNVDEAVMFLKGKDEDLIGELTDKMNTYSKEMRYEEAAVTRDRIDAIKKIVEVQKVITSDTKDRDIIGIYREGLSLGISILFTRGGRLVGSFYQLFRNVLDEDPEALQSFLEQFYRGDRYIPDEILLPKDVPDIEVLEGWLNLERKTTIKIPKRGILKGLVKMAEKNAETSFAEWKRTKESKEEAIGALTRRLGLSAPPKRMECFDISNIHGSLSVGSMAVFIDGDPEKGEYRHFKIRGSSGADDYAMMDEVIRRRMKNLVDDNLPDLIVIDGGKGHLNMAASVLKDLGIKDIPVVSIAKERIDKTKPDKLYLPGRKNPITVRGSSSAFFLLMQLRDEAHRFAVEYHRKLRRKRSISSALDEIPGVGENRKKSLLKHFQRVGDIKGASIEELQSVPGISPKLAKAIKEYFSES